MQYRDTSFRIENARMLPSFYCKKMIKTAGKKKKTVLYGIFAAAVVFAFLHVTYFNEAYSPLQVLSDARSEAKRLLRFITLYHYQCNSTIQGLNTSQWPVCIEKAGGLNLVLGGPRIMYSVGPTTEYPLERILALNYSYSVYVFHHEPLLTDFIQSTRNKTRIVKTTIVPNDPSDYGRNSYSTQTLNSVFETLKHQVVDILKIELLADRGHSHELLYYLVKDHILSTVRQLHLALYIDKVDDDFLYSWYKALYMLFQNEGFRMYHSGASDSLCLQVTLMESCVYYMSWIRDPGPETFVLYPPAIDGSNGFEVNRLQDYLEDTESTCDKELDAKVLNSKITICMDVTNINPSKPCQLVVIRVTNSLDPDETPRYAASHHDPTSLQRNSAGDAIPFVPQTKCKLVVLSLELHSHDETKLYVTQHGHSSENSKRTSLSGALQQHFQLTTDNLLYVDSSQSFWKVLHKILNSGALYNVNQLIMNIQNIFVGSQSSEIRRRFSELKRLESYGFRKYQILDEDSDSTLRFKSKHTSNPSYHRLNYLKSASSWSG